jgi:hypothetical protein
MLKMSKKVTFRCVSEGDERRMMLVDVETELKIVSRRLDNPKVDSPMRVNFGNISRVRAELTRYAIKHDLEII